MAEVRSARQVWWVVLTVMAAVALVWITWLVASRFQSPMQREASAAPPPPAPVLVEVVRGDLAETTTVNLQGKAAGGRSVVIPLRDSTSVVTRPGVGSNSELSAGQVVLWVNSRPVFALRGAFPFYRDITEGDEGDDVSMLQQALADIGYDIFPDGEFGSYTASCVRDLYASVGAEPVTRTVTVDGPTREAESPQSGSSNGSPTGAGDGRIGKKENLVVFPTGEAVVVGYLPARVRSVPVEGTILSAENAKLVLSGDGVTLEGEIPATVAARLSTATTGNAVFEGRIVPVRVDSIKTKGENKDDTSGEEQKRSDESILTLVAANGSLPAEWAGKDTINVSLNLSEPLVDVLQVPQRAIAADSSGTNVLVQTSDELFEQVKVAEKVCVAGVCVLEENDRVKAGMKLRIDR